MHKYIHIGRFNVDTLKKKKKKREENEKVDNSTEQEVSNR